MDNAQKAIMIGVGLFITIIIIAAVMAITGIGQNLLNQGQSQLGGLSDQLQREIYDAFDNKELSGSEVLSAVKKYYTDTKISVIVLNASGTTFNTATTLKIGAMAITGLTAKPVASDLEVVLDGSTKKLTDFDTTTTIKTPLSYFSDSMRTNEYIAPSKTYRSLIVKQNDAVVGILFSKM